MHTTHTRGQTGRKLGQREDGDWEVCRDDRCPEPSPDPYDFPRCATYWGSHGCDLERNHEGEWHVCGAFDEDGPCSLHNGEVVQFFEVEPGPDRFTPGPVVALSDPRPMSTY